MKRYVTDTHALLWHILGSKRLSSRAKSIFEDTDKGRGQIYIPAIALVEIVYLMEKAKIPPESVENVIKLFDSHPKNYTLAQITPPTIHALISVPRELIPEMPDRIIMATAAELGLPLITKDSKIKAAKVVKVIW